MWGIFNKRIYGSLLSAAKVQRAGSFQQKGLCINVLLSSIVHSIWFEVEALTGPLVERDESSEKFNFLSCLNYRYVKAAVTNVCSLS
jgi:hypothetical protein